MSAGQGSLFGPEVGTAGPEAAEAAASAPSGPPVAVPVDARALLQPWRDAGVLSAADVHLATTLARLAGLGDGSGGPDGAGVLTPAEADVVLGAALAARAPRLGHVCLDLATVRQSVPAEVEGDADVAAAESIDALPWPTDVDAWRRSLAGSPLVAVAVDGQVPAAEPGRGVPLVLDGTLLYLERYRVYEERVAAELRRRAEAAAAAPSGGADLDALFAVFGSSPEQRAAAEAGAKGQLSVVVGGPGTGKTTTVAALLAVLLAAEPDTRIALVAPTGKAAARMQESIVALAARLRGSDVADAASLADRLAAADVSTIHRRLGWRPDGFRHRRANPLVHDVVIVDETSMVSLPLMAHLLDAVRPDARLVLVGDPGQLASVEAGSVLGDVAGPAVDAALAGAAAPVGPLSGCVTVLTQSYRFPASSPVGRFAVAVRAGDADTAVHVLQTAADDPTATGVTLHWRTAGADTDPGADAVRAAALEGARRTVDAAEAGDADAALAALAEVRVLCAHRRGPFGVARWNWQFEEWLAADGRHPSGFYVGRPVLVTANDPSNELYNGDLGVAVATDDGVRVAFPHAGARRLLAPSRLEDVDTVHAMTIHKSQGSEFDEVVVVLPPEGSRLATRELLYTAVTRARRAVTLVGSEDALRRAIDNRVVRQTGLRQRLWPT